MLYKEAVTPHTWELLVELMQDDALHSFILVGGTALSLQIGHRKSIDLGLFSTQEFNQIEMLEYLKTKYQFDVEFVAKSTLKGFVKSVFVDLITHKYDWVQNLAIIEKVRFAGMKDIVAMKLNAIVGNGTRIKDFIDIAFLSTKMNMRDMVDSYYQKYKVDSILALKSLTYFEEVNTKEPIQMLNGKFSWRKIQSRLQAMQNNPNRVFNSLPN